MAKETDGFALSLDDAKMVDSVVSEWLNARAEGMIESYSDDGDEDVHDFALRLGRWIGARVEGTDVQL